MASFLRHLTALFTFERCRIALPLFLCIALLAAGESLADEILNDRPFRPHVPPGTTVPEHLRFDLEFQDGPNCGPNAIYAMLRLSGYPVAYADVASRITASAEGADLQSMAVAARDFGLDVEVRKGVSPEDLLGALVPIVVHLQASPVDSRPLARDHFVVVSGVRIHDNGDVLFDIVDTTNLRFMHYRLDQLAQSMTGYGLTRKGGISGTRARAFEPVLFACLAIVLVSDVVLLTSIYFRARA